VTDKLEYLGTVRMSNEVEVIRLGQFDSPTDLYLA
jgi:hypothetical protein